MLQAARLAVLLSLAAAISLNAASWRHHKAAKQASDSHATSTKASAEDRGPETPASQLAAGTVIKAELQSEIDSWKSKVSDSIVARVTADVKQDGKIIIHKGDRLAGRVVAVQTGSGPEFASVSVAFDRLVTRHSVMPLSTVLTAVEHNPDPGNESGAGQAASSSRSAHPSGGLLGGVSGRPVLSGVASSAAKPGAGLLGDSVRATAPATHASPRDAVSLLTEHTGPLRIKSGAKLEFQVVAAMQAMARK